MFKFTLYLWAIVIMILGFSIVPTCAMVTAIIVGATAGVLEVKRQKWMKERKRNLQKRHDDYMREFRKNKINNSKVSAGTLLAGAALAHQLRKHHEHEDKDIDDEGFDDLYDDDIDDFLDDYNDYKDYDDIDLDNYIDEQIEEQAAYEDYIASLDRDD